MAGTVTLWRREAVFLAAMLAVETSVVGISTLFKVATSKGLNLSLSSSCFSSSSSSFFLLHQQVKITSSTKFLITLSMYVITGYIGIQYSNPTLGSAINNITPALTFILAVIFRMEKVSFKERTSVAKVMGTILSLIGALVVIFYHGPRIFVAFSPPYLNFRQLSPPLSSPNSDWLIGGALFTLQSIFVSVSFILQAQIMSEYPSAFKLSFLYTVCVSIVTSTIGLVVEKNNPSVWIIRFDITFITIVTMGIVTSVYYVIHSVTVRYKGPVYLAIFKPLSILIAVVMGTIFLNDSLYLGCLIGGILITLGFYAVMNEEKDKLLAFSDKEKIPLLLNDNNNQI